MREAKTKEPTMASTKTAARTATDTVITSAGEHVDAANVVVTDVGAAFKTAATIPASKAAIKKQKAHAKKNAKPATKSDDRRKLADRVLAHVATMTLTDDEKALVANWLFGLPMNRDNWPTVLPKPTRGIWVKDADAATATTATK
jgi:hypothetical protein